MNLSSIAIQCVKKHYDTVFRMTAVPVEIKFYHLTWKYEPAHVQISPLLYRAYPCRGCGRCCGPAKAIIWDAPLFNETPDCSKHPITINGVKHYIFVSKVGGPCIYLTPDNRCSIYPDRPLLSRMPHIFVDMHKETTVSLTSRQYGRNWALHCEAEETILDAGYYRNVFKPTLKYLGDVISIYGVESQFPRIWDGVLRHMEEGLLIHY